MRERLQLRGLSQRIALTFLHLRVDVVVALVVRSVLGAGAPVETLRPIELLKVVAVRTLRRVVGVQSVQVVVLPLVVWSVVGFAAALLVGVVFLDAILPVLIHLGGAWCQGFGMAFSLERPEAQVAV